MSQEPVITELIGTTFVVAINRPEVRNAVNGAVAKALAEAFRTFEENDNAKVAVLAGEGGTFCAGADLRAIGTPDANRVTSDGNAPRGPTRMILSKPVIAAINGSPSPAEWNSRCGATCASWKKTRHSASSVDDGACRSSTAERSDSRESSAPEGPWT